MGIFEESRIFKDERVLLPDYLPEMLPHREEQIRQLARNIQPVARGRQPQNTFIYGSPGIGKTAVARYVFREFEGFANVKTIYINCWDFKTSYAILTQLVQELGGFVPRRGWAKDEIVARLAQVLRGCGEGVVVCLDEVDRIIPHEQEVLYNLLRMGQYARNPIGLILIANDPSVMLALEPRIKSSLRAEQLEFKPYSLGEMRDILRDRVRHAFRAGTVEEAVILLAANRAVQKGGDVRVGLECLLRAGRLAEDEESSKVLVKHMKAVLKGVGEAKPRIMESRLDEASRIALAILAQEKELRVKELYELYAKRSKSPLAMRTFRERVKKLAELGLVKERVKRRTKERVLVRTY
jgi:cell division control protein 6